MSSHQLSFTLGYNAMTLRTTTTHTAPASWSPSVFCIWKGYTAVPCSVRAKWWHPFFPMKHGWEEKTRNRDQPPEGHPWQRYSNRAHLATTSETSELDRGKVCATLSLAQHIRNWEVSGSFLPPAQHSASQATCGFIRWENALKPLLSVLLREIWLPGTSTRPPAQRQQAQHKQKHKSDQKKAFKWVCTKTFQEASFMKGLKINKAALFCNYSLIVQDKSTGCNGKRGRRPNSFLM